MKILMVNKFLYSKGGSEIYMIKLGKHLVQSGNDVQYFGMSDQKNTVGNEIGAYVSNINYQGKLSALHKIKVMFNSIYSFHAKKQIGIVLDNFKPDVVHLNNFNYQITPSIIYEIKKRNIPIVQTVHDTQIMCPCHRCYIEHKQKICMLCENGNYMNCVKNRCLHNSLSKSIVAALESYYYHIRKTYNKIDVFVCPSKFIAEKIIKGGVIKDKIRILCNYTEVRNKVLPQNNISEKYILYFGRLSKEKGINHILNVATSLNNVKFVFAGKGPLQDKIEEASKKHNNIEYVGYKSGYELDNLISNAKFTICYSECHENCPLSVVESQALGTPVIGSNLGGIPELIIDGVNGIIIDGMNESELAKEIVRLWSDDNLLELMSNNCTQIKQNNIVEYEIKLMEIYKSVVEA